jgi:hypothetical protein
MPSSPLTPRSAGWRCRARARCRRRRRCCARATTATPSAPVFRRSKERVKLESEALDERYEIFAGKGQDPIRLRRLFSPTFIVWLTDSAPQKFAFELVDGTLCCYVHGHKEKAAELDTIRAASAAVTTRLREEALE